ncbi:hypothetical protein [Sulfurimonas sp. CS5]|jgi:LysM repeat protein|uniref:hypothetical protein n=1 Tax=Sulfurimonas sp. CS5 TaxID=3391145 RepID=UPI0039ED45F0
MSKINLENLNTIVTTTVTSEIDIANIIKNAGDSNGTVLDNTKLLVSSLGTLETFASVIIKEFPTSIGITTSASSLLLNIATATMELKDPKYNGSIQNSTLNSIFADSSSLLASAGLAAKNPQALIAGLAGSATFSVAAFMSTENDTSMADGIVGFANDIKDVYGDAQTEIDNYLNSNDITFENYIDYNNTTDFDKPTLRDFLNDYEKPDTQNPEPDTPEPKVTIDPETNTATLNSGGTISEVASKTDYTSAELLEYNGISLEDARNLPIGTEIKIPEKVNTLQGEYGNIKMYQDKEGNLVSVVPNEDGTKSIHNTFSDNPSLYVEGNLSDPNNIHFTNDNGISEVWSKDSNGNFYQSQV